MFYRGVASGTASKALALLDFWLAGPIIQRVVIAPLLAGAITPRVFAPALIVGVIKQILRVR